MGFITEYANGSVFATHPDPKFGTSSERVFELFALENLLSFALEAVNVYKINENDITAWEVLLGIVEWALHQAL